MGRQYKNKTERKTRRVVDKVSEEFGIKSQENPSKVILLCNAGLMTGISFEQIFELFCKYGDISDILLLPGRSFSFVQFADETGAAEAFEGVHGKLGIVNDDEEQVLYLSFIDKMPLSTTDTAKEWTNPLPEGLKVFEDFLSLDEEEQILSTLKWNDMEEDSRLKYRQVIHFGRRFLYQSNTVEEDSTVEPFPDDWMPILQRAVDLGCLPYLPDQCTVNRYEPGQGIPPHVDSHECCDDTLASLSLLSGVVMSFRSLEDTGSDDTKCSVFLKPRSLLVLTGKSRYSFSHGITPRQHDIVPCGVKESSEPRLTLLRRGLRISLTFRKAIVGPCRCPYDSVCPSKTKSHIGNQLDASLASELEKTHVHSVYEKIAGHFSDTRHKKWPKVEAFVDSLPVGSFLVDVGCGNGKYLGNKTLVEVGCDYSEGLLGICRDRQFEVVRSNCLALPFRSSSVDACICIAVIHHLSTEDRRMQAVDEILRILRPGGAALIYAWAQDQHKNSEPSSYLKQKKTKKENDSPTETSTVQVNENLITLPVHRNRTNFEHSDLFVPWKTKVNSTSEIDSQTYLRYYHVFKDGELEKMILNSSIAESVTIDESYYDQGNWCVKMRKKESSVVKLS